METVQERFLAAIRQETERIMSRRQLLVRTGRIAAGGTAVTALGALLWPAGSPAQNLAASPVASPAGTPVPSAIFSSDLDVLTYALTLEQLEFAFYRDALTTFPVAAFAGKRPIAFRTLLENVRDQEQEHVATLTTAVTQLGGTPPAEGTYDFGYGQDLDKFFTVAAAIETTGVAAYHGALPWLQNKDLIAAGVGIFSVEARHSAFLNERIGQPPFPNSIEPALSRPEVTSIVGRLTK